MNDDRPPLTLRRYERLAVRQRRLRLSAAEIAERTAMDDKAPLGEKYVQNVLSGRVRLAENSESNAYARIEQALASFERDRDETTTSVRAAA
ncbi:MAG: hypothetical protein AAFQ53_16675 [Bacteroidota bacterium]